MKYVHEKFWLRHRGAFLALLISSTGFVIAQDVALDNIDQDIDFNETEVVTSNSNKEDPKSINAKDSIIFTPVDADFFDRDLIPAKFIYGNSWDSLHVDSPNFEPSFFETGFTLELIPDDCEYVFPFQGRVTSKFGWRWNRMHKGYDIDLNTGDPVVAAFDGVIRIVKSDYGGFGNYILIRHYNGLETIYAHLSGFAVKPNQTVKAGEVIGFGGNTGRSTGSHLHFETRFMGQAFDPSLIIDFNTFQLKSNTFTVEQSCFLYIINPYQYQKQFAQYHKIRKGDTLSHIARRYGTSVTALCRINGMSRNTVLRIGRTIRVK